MKLSLYERMVLMNQFTILSKVDPENAKTYDNNFKILQLGLSGAYKSILPIDEEEVSPEECSEVLAILEMFRHINTSSKEVNGLTDQEKASLKFYGFDATNEKKSYAYATHLLKNEGRYPELSRECEDKDLNSHIQVMSKYRKMLAKYQELGSPMNMNEKTLNELADATKT